MHFPPEFCRFDQYFLMHFVCRSRYTWRWDSSLSLLAAPRLGRRPRHLSVSAPHARRRCHPGRHGRRRVAGPSLYALISLRNGWRGERDVALHRAGLPAAVCLLQAVCCSPVTLCQPHVRRTRSLQRGAEAECPCLRLFGSDRRATPDLGASVVPVCTWWVPVLGAAAHA